ncbi:MAG: hypothetical protein IJX44_08225 [Bacteroidaceae bacterium]|nr:hypothetical protein [Bacteroidaceae bacterium]
MMKTNNLMEREYTIVSANHYEAPRMEVIEVAVEKGYAATVEGYASDSDDSEFGGASERRGSWGNLWETGN